MVEKFKFYSQPVKSVKNKLLHYMYFSEPHETPTDYSGDYYRASEVDAELKKLKALEGMHEAAHKIANGYLADSRDTHIADKICLIGNQRNALRRCNAELKRELTDIKESYRNVLAEPCESDDRVHCTCVPTLRAEIERLRGILSQIADGLNTPYPFPDISSEHDDLLIESAVEAGKALQAIGNEILKADWNQWSEIPSLVKAALKEAPNAKDS